MKFVFNAALLLVICACNLFAQDPAKTDSDKYSVVLENERVRVLEYRDTPGSKTTLHEHPDFVLYAIAPFKRKLTFPDGKFLIREFKTGDVVWMKAQKHIGENIGQTDTHVLIVEVKEPLKKPLLKTEKKK
jgi:beta-alanine degradation protein BauB